MKNKILTLLELEFNKNNRSNSDKALILEMTIQLETVQKLKGNTVKHPLTYLFKNLTKAKNDK